MAERQIGHWKSSLVLSARFPVVKWRSRSVAKSAPLFQYVGAAILENEKTWECLWEREPQAIGDGIITNRFVCPR